MKLTKTTSRHRLRPRFHWVYGPGLILKDEVSWRNWNGFAFRIGDDTFWFEVRRFRGMNA
ncbi:UNVERIFIED_ORG: hypothetical protein M2328_005737 [Rhodococcus erythropolis]